MGVDRVHGGDGSGVDPTDVLGDLFGSVDLAEVSEVVLSDEVGRCFLHLADVEDPSIEVGSGGDGVEREEVLVVTVGAGVASVELGGWVERGPGEETNG